LIFLGSDGKRYALDPVMTNGNTRPIPLTKYLPLFNQYDSTLYVFKYGYTPNTDTTVLNDEIIRVSNASQLALYAMLGKIKAEMDAFGQPTKATFLSTFLFEGIDATALLPA